MKTANLNKRSKSRWYKYRHWRLVCAVLLVFVQIVPHKTQQMNASACYFELETKLRFVERKMLESLFKIRRKHLLLKLDHNRTFDRRCDGTSSPIAVIQIKSSSKAEAVWWNFECREPAGGDRILHQDEIVNNHTGTPSLPQRLCMRTICCLNIHFTRSNFHEIPQIWNRPFGKFTGKFNPKPRTTKNNT